MADRESENDPALDGLQGQVLAGDGLGVGRVQKLIGVGDQRQHLEIMDAFVKAAFTHAIALVPKTHATVDIFL
jgi:hypothetical protein